MNTVITITRKLSIIVFYGHLLSGICYATKLLSALTRLQQVYPEHIQAVSESYIHWDDGTIMPVTDRAIALWQERTMQEKIEQPTLADQLEQIYISGIPSNPETYTPVTDPGRIRYEPFFRKMYGNSSQEVKNNLEIINWMPRIFGSETYLLRVTRINQVHEKLQCVSHELEELVLRYSHFKQFLDKPGGTFNWRFIANTQRLSNHSFGMTIDINVAHSHYWQWDLKREGQPVSETTPLVYRNAIPWEIVLIFEKYGFIWGGKWRHYDTMHFEYRPELFF